MNGDKPTVKHIRYERVDGSVRYRRPSPTEAGIPLLNSYNAHRPEEIEYYALKTELFRLIRDLLGDSSLYSFLQLSEQQRMTFSYAMGLRKEYDAMADAYIEWKDKKEGYNG